MSAPASQSSRATSRCPFADAEIKALLCRSILCRAIWCVRLRGGTIEQVVEEVCHRAARAAKPTWQRTAASCSWQFQFGPTVATSTHPHERTHTHTHIEAHARMRTYTLALRASSPAVCTTRTQTKAQYEHTCAEDNSTTQAPTTDSQTHAQLLEGGMRRGARMTGGGAAWADKRCPSERGRPLSGGDLGREALSGGVREGGGHCQGEPWG